MVGDTEMNDSIQVSLVGEVSAFQDGAMNFSDKMVLIDDSSLGKKSSIDERQSNSPKPNKTIVLVGHTGSGKSATGNTILGRRVFKSMPVASSVTITCELQTEILADGQTINVIDTQGFGDNFEHPELHIEELVNCFELAKNEIHAILFVVSVRSQFSKEAAAAIHNLQKILGSNVVNYVIVVFTGGDDLEDINRTFNDYLGHDCPDPLKDIIRLCGDRRILFDNRTKIDRKKSEQVRELLLLVENVVLHNGGNPFKHQLYELKKRNQELLNEANKIYTLSNCDKPMSEKANENSNISIVLVGHTGSGKSATGNTILGRRAFKSMPSASSVTITCELQTEILADGRTINVIDTQGFGDNFAHPDLHVEELTKCFELAKNEIHAILFVVSVRSQFSKEEAAAIHNLQTLLGSNVVNYVIVVFTGGDELEDQNRSFNYYLGHDCPDPLKDIIRLCGDRCILFDNRTTIERKKHEQAQELLSHVQKIKNHNGENLFKHRSYESKGDQRKKENAIRVGDREGDDAEEGQKYQKKDLGNKIKDTFTGFWKN